MKILVFTLDFPPTPGGVAIFLHNLCLQLCRQGHNVDVLTRSEKSQEIDKKQPYRVYRYSPFKRLSSLKPILSTIYLHQKNRYQVLFMGHFATSHALGVFFLHKLLGIPYVILSHGNDLTRYSIHTKADEVIARLLLNNASLVFANSRFTAECLQKRKYSGRIEILNPGVDVKQFHYQVDTGDICKKYELEGRCVLLTVSRLTAKKNIDGVLRVLPKVIQQIPNVLYLIVGDGEERENLKALTDKLHIRQYVHFLGHTENSKLPALYCSADVFVMPSYVTKDTGDIETFGISFIEASACGKPVIAGKSGGVADAVIDGKTGIFVDPHSVNEMADAIIRLFTDKNLARRLGENGRRRVEKELNWEAVGNTLNNIIIEAIGHNN
ncbi:MAG: glycosyltransferase family 4 protein [Candidatus Scalindua sp.]